MEISSPLCITSRLLPGCRIGDAELSIEYAYVTSDGRQCYCWYIDNADPEENWHSTDLQSGIGGGTLQEGLESLLSFLGAFAEANYQNCEQDSENANLFPVGLAEWAVQNQDAISEMELELQEHPNELIIE